MNYYFWYNLNNKEIFSRKGNTPVKLYRIIIKNY